MDGEHHWLGKVFVAGFVILGLILFIPLVLLFVVVLYVLAIVQAVLLLFGVRSRRIRFTAILGRPHWNRDPRPEPGPTIVLHNSLPDRSADDAKPQE